MVLEKHVSDLIDVISSGPMDNTYKVAGRALVELCASNRAGTNFTSMSSRSQSSSITGTNPYSLISNRVRRLTDDQKSTDRSGRYQQQLENGYQPRTFIKAENDIEVPSRRISSVLAQDVCKRFVRLGKRELMSTTSI